VRLPRMGLGCMSLSHAYGTPPSLEDGVALVRSALDDGVQLLDTATLYGGGRNEELVGRAIAGRRDEVVLASKGGMALVDGVKVIDGRPETLRAQVDASLRRLGVEHIDLYYLHRWDKKVPIAESVGALAEMVAAGKIGAIGLSEVSVDRLREALAAAPIAAVQNEYSLWSRNPELGILDATRDAGVALVAFSPVGRGYLADSITDPEQLPPKDIRRAMPRFQPEHWAANAALLRWRGEPSPPRPAARRHSWPWRGCSPAAITSCRSPGARMRTTCARTSALSARSSIPRCSCARAS